MRLGQIRTPEDVYDWMDENIQYGWLDTENGQHIGEMKNFRKSYRTMSLEEILEYRFGTCIEQVALMKFYWIRSGLKIRCSAAESMNRMTMEI